MSFGEQLARTQLPRRILGVMLAVLVPGAGHIVLGYSALGWTVAAVALVLGAGTLAAALALATHLFILLGAAGILFLVLSAVSILALPPGPRLKDGLRALWPALVLAVVFRGVTWLVPAYVVSSFSVEDMAMLPQIASADVLFATARPRPVQPGDVVFVEDPKRQGRLLLVRVIATAGQRVHLDGTSVAIDGRAVVEQSATEIGIIEAGDAKDANARKQHRYTRTTEIIAGRAFPVLHDVPPAASATDTTVGADEVFVLGDNRDHSVDSRSFGPLPLSRVRATALFVFGAGNVDGRERIWKPLWSAAP